MEFRRLGGKLRELLGSTPSLWLPFVRNWTASGRVQWRACSFPCAKQLVLAPCQDYYESYQYFCETRGGRCEIEAFNRNLRCGDVMLDVGGFRGAYTMAAKACFPNLRITVFEPVHANSIRIREVIALNKFSDIDIREVAVGNDEPLQGLISARDGMLRNASGSESEQVEIPTCSIDRFTKETGVVPTVIKVDVDGFEWDVLKGAEQCLRRSRPRLWLELHPTYLADRKIEVSTVTEFLQSFGYKLETFSDFCAPDSHVAYHIWALPLRDGLDCSASAS